MSELDDAADTIGGKRKSAQEPIKRHSRSANDKLDYPITSLLVLGAVVIGGSMLVAAMFHDDQDGSGETRRPMRLASAVNGLGPRGTEALSRIRDAAFSFMFDKAVDTVDGMFPGFREHYERG
jgi:hypothetical protein